LNWVLLVQRLVEFEDVNARLAKQTQCTTFRVIVDQFLDVLKRGVACVRNALGLECGAVG
jgi:hypothetical protein